jgi:hypothetical protein
VRSGEKRWAEKREGNGHIHGRIKEKEGVWERERRENGGVGWSRVAKKVGAQAWPYISIQGWREGKSTGAGWGRSGQRGGKGGSVFGIKRKNQARKGEEGACRAVTIRESKRGVDGAREAAENKGKGRHERGGNGDPEKRGKTEPKKERQKEKHMRRPWGRRRRRREAGRNTTRGGGENLVRKPRHKCLWRRFNSHGDTKQSSK